MAIWDRKNIVTERREKLINSFLSNMEETYNNLQDLKEDIKSIPGVDKLVGEDVFKKEVFRTIVSPVSYNRKLEDRYCMVSIIKCLMDADKEGILTEYGFLPENAERSTLCSSFVEHLEKSKFKDFLYKTHKGETFVGIIDKKDIKEGAIIILTNMKKDTTEEIGPQEDVTEASIDGRNHAMVFSSRDKETGKPMFSGFGNERSNIFIDRYKLGYVLDLSSCVEKVFSMDEILKLKNELKLDRRKEVMQRIFLRKTCKEKL